MSMAECRSCHRVADSRSFRSCVDCGALLCDDCANEYDGLCPDCDGQEPIRVFHNLRDIL
ncbi:MAG: hypothetical protein Q4C10_03375 [Clostridia bacterium]|nr:hypothetical protein [Clostridia bacterium]